MSNRPHIKPKDAVTMAQYLLAHAVPQGDCLVLDPGKKAYPGVQFQGKAWQAHRFIFHTLVEPVDDEDTVHHQCENKRCVRLGHLEKMTRGQHLALHDLSSFQRDKTCCPQGHLYSQENTINVNGKRMCRECNRTRARLAWRAGAKWQGKTYNAKSKGEGNGKVA